ncbi:dicarboxylate transporter/tellurite-resistance protein TehA [Mannheimia massilioguelmaensis]|uniref:dicarboxylate transporter/tellurite-resistance protein TehA n=1 Tax=Mannheimia massilioguelmaensis TaxID=1604354 RepID=UPI0005CB12F8|nr:dicarboxylate transporter/tellurite-resistance protein TehA [Mannheimia massilioguelmaensis]
MLDNKPFPIPVNYFALTLGLSSLGFAWRYAATVINVPAWSGELIGLFASVVWASFVIVYVYKWINYPQLARAEVTHPITGCFVSLMFISGIFVGLLLNPYTILGAYVSFTCIALQVSYAVYRSAGLWQGRQPQEFTTPALYLPIVPANWVSAIGLVLLGEPDIAILFFGAGCLFWIMIEPTIQQRLRNIADMPMALRPTLGIQLAPAFVCSSSYLTINGGEIDFIVKMLMGYGVLQFFFISRLLGWMGIFRHFHVGYWAISFGLAAMAGDGIHIYAMTHGQGAGIVGLPMFWVGSCSIGLLFIATLGLVLKGKFLLK